jgi:Kef-type K+ transport system membrane component KefB
MEQSIFYQLAIVMVITAVVSLLLRAFRQPLIIGYIVTGILVGPSFLNIIHSHEAFESFSQIGITLLLFVIGLGLNVGIIKDTGKPVFVIFSSIVAGVGGLGLLIATLMGFEFKGALVLATALLFSSTIIVIKALSDKREQSRLYGQIAIGVLLVEDLAATIALLLVSTSTSSGADAVSFPVLLARGAFLASCLAIVGGLVMPRLSRLFAASQELLYVFALAWAFGVASIFRASGFSLEVGALFAGVALAHLPYVQAIASKLKPLRDFFIVLFFIGLGEQLGLGDISDALLPALIFSAVIMVVKPLLIMGSLGVLGYTKQTGFKAAIHLSQISEFSIVLIVLAVDTQLIKQEAIAITTLTALITIAISAYLMKYDDQLYRLFQKPLSFFERSDTKRELRSLGHYPLMLIGYSEGGNSFVKTFRQMKRRYVVIDYDPDVIEVLERQHINHLYGDATDTELLEEINIHKSELIISTISNASTNRELVDFITSANPDAVFICHADTLNDAEKLYEAGASYVLLPHHIGDEHIRSFIARNGSNKKAFHKYRRKHLLQLGSLAVK